MLRDIGFVCPIRIHQPISRLKNGGRRSGETHQRATPSPPPQTPLFRLLFPFGFVRTKTQSPQNQLPPRPETCYSRNKCRPILPAAADSSKPSRWRASAPPKPRPKPPQRLRRPPPRTPLSPSPSRAPPCAIPASTPAASLPCWPCPSAVSPPAASASADAASFAIGKSSTAPIKAARPSTPSLPSGRRPAAASPSRTCSKPASCLLTKVPMASAPRTRPASAASKAQLSPASSPSPKSPSAIPACPSASRSMPSAPSSPSMPTNPACPSPSCATASTTPARKPPPFPSPGRSKTSYGCSAPPATPLKAGCDECWRNPLEEKTHSAADDPLGNRSVRLSPCFLCSATTPGAQARVFRVPPSLKASKWSLAFRFTDVVKCGEGVKKRPVAMKAKKGDQKKMKAQSLAQVRATISFPPEVYETLEVIAKEKKVSLAWVVREAAEKYIADKWPLLARS